MTDLFAIRRTQNNTDPISGVTVEPATLDAALATQLLATNTGNRPVKLHNVGRFAEDMIAGRWAFTGEPIKIDRNGVLLDGQNRCFAVIRANEEVKGISIPVLIVRGLDPQAQDQMDTGSPRSVGDQLSRRGVSKYAMLAAATRVMCMYKSNAQRPLHSVMLQYFDDHKDVLNEAADAIHDSNNSSGVNTSVLIAARCLINEVSKDEVAVDTFFVELSTGAGLEDGSPILALRTRAQTAKMRREYITNIHYLNMVIRAWNAWRKGEDMKKFPLWGRGNGVGPLIIKAVR